MRLMDTLRSWYYSAALRLRGARVGRRLRVQGPLQILLRDGGDLRNVRIGNDVTLGGRTYLRIRKQGKVTLGDGVRTATEIWLVSANDAELSIGPNSVIGSYSILNGGHGIRIGSDCLLAGFVYINSSDHRFARGELIREQGHCGAPVDIGNDVWIGGHVAVTKGVKIGTGAVVGAGAVVVKDVPDYMIAVGNPAQPIRERT
jgi:acetyltransferase-like isoleucine patch superfamily enzyme